jgi:fibronectin type 3 domain-containing protein
VKLFIHDWMRTLKSLNITVLALVFPLLLAACSGGSGGLNTNSAPVPPGSPAPPVTSNSATLAWDPVTAPNLSGYRVYYGTAPGTYQQSYGQGIVVSNATAHTLLGLSSGTRYYFVVTAFDSSGNESAYSNEAFKDIS